MSEDHHICGEAVSGDRFPLMSLPPELRFMIIRYVDRKTMRQMLVTSSSMCGIVRRNRKFLTPKKLPVLGIRSEHSHGKLELVTTVLHQKPDEEAYIFPMLSKKDSDAYGTRYKMMDDDTERTPFLQHFAESFENTQFKRLELDNFPLHRLKVDQFHKLVRRNRIVTQVLLIKDLQFENASDLVNFFSMFKPKKIYILERDPETMRRILCSNFLNLIPRLELLALNWYNAEWSSARIDFRIDGDKIPRILIFEGAFISDIALIRKGIHCWWNDEIDVSGWGASLEDHWTIPLVAQAIGLPTVDPKDNRLKYYSPNRKEQKTLRMYPMIPPLRWYWAVHTQEYETSCELY